MSKHTKYTMPLKKRGHGAKGYWIEGEGYYGPDGGDPQKVDNPAEMMSDGEQPAKLMKFCRMFDLDKLQPDRAALEALGQSMADASKIVDAVDNPPDSTIPAGFTYFGQFVDHDISRTASSIELGEEGESDVSNERTPSLDLDSLYGAGPEIESFYEEDGVRLRIGSADKVDVHGAPQLPNDLPRKEPEAGKVPRPADIGDHRNDENLAVAQTHLAFLKFHNKVLDDPSKPGDLEGVRKVVRQHYQSIVFSDFLPRLVDPSIYTSVVENGRQWFRAGSDNKSVLCMPIEFSVAAYRLGHTMVRNRYEWNRVFRTGGQVGIASLVNLFQFSELSGNFTPISPEGNGAPRLPSNWVANWLLMYDFSEIPGVNSDPKMNFARPLNTVLAEKLADLEEFNDGMTEPVLRHLAIRNLLRGSQLGLASGQQIASKIGSVPLTSDEISSGPHGDLLKLHGFDTETPLWYYILKESEVKHGSQHLGAVGSTIVVETFHGLLEASEDSILKETNWAPSLASASGSHYTMADMLAYVGDINPLGDAPLT